MKTKRLFCILIPAVMCLMLIGCRTRQSEVKGQISLVISTTPIGLGTVPDLGAVTIYDLFTEAAQKFKAHYDEYDVDFEISLYNYMDEQEQLADKYGTDEAVDIFFSGSWNVPTYVARGWLVPLNDILDDELRFDIDEMILAQNSINDQLYTMPFQQLQNTLMVNRKMMKEAGLQEYIPEGDSIAHWSTDDFNTVFDVLQDSITDMNKFVFMMYAANNQGDNHIMTLLRSHGGTLYDEDGNFAVNTPEGIAALEWIANLNEEGITPKGAENFELLDCVNLFYNEQLAICMGNLTNMWDAWNRGLDVFAVNFPSLDGNGYCTSSTNGFCIFDNGDEDKIRVAKDFIRFIYTDEDMMKYTLGTLPVNRSVIQKYGDEIRMLKAYGENTSNTVDNIHNNLGWQGVRDVFYPNIQNLLLGTKTPAEVAADIDKSCNIALQEGLRELK